MDSPSRTAEPISIELLREISQEAPLRCRLAGESRECHAPISSIIAPFSRRKSLQVRLPLTHKMALETTMEWPLSTDRRPLFT